MRLTKLAKNSAIGQTAILILDASACVDLLQRTPIGRLVATRLGEESLHAPAHLDAEVLSALGRLYRAGDITQTNVSERLDIFGVMPIERHPLASLLLGAWHRRGNLRLVDALYVELASQLDTIVITTDQRLAQATALAEVVA